MTSLKEKCPLCQEHEAEYKIQNLDIFGSIVFKKFICEFCKTFIINKDFVGDLTDHLEQKRNELSSKSRNAPVGSLLFIDAENKDGTVIFPSYLRPIDSWLSDQENGNL